MRTPSLRRSAQKLKRAAFKLSLATSPRRRERVPRQVIFPHIPKSAGTSLNVHLKNYLGSRRSGQSKFICIDIFQPAETHLTEAELEGAKQAVFVSGHFSWRLARQLAHPDTFTFTFLRKPANRLISLYNYATRLPDGTFKPHIEGLHGMSMEAFFTSENPHIRHAVDNYMTRQFAGVFDADLSCDPEASPVLEKAIANLHTLSFIGFVEHFDDDVSRLLAQIGLPAADHVAQLHRTGNKAHRLEPSDEVLDRIDRFTRFDDEIYRRFLSERNRT